MAHPFNSGEKNSDLIMCEFDQIEQNHISWSIGRMDKSERNTCRYIFYGLLYDFQSRDKNNEAAKPFMTQLKFSLWKLIIALQISSIPWIQNFFDYKNSAFLDIFSLFLSSAIFIVWIYFFILLAIYFSIKKIKHILPFLWRIETILRVIIFKAGYIPIAYSLAVAIKSSLYTKNSEFNKYSNQILNKNSSNFIGLCIATTFLLAIFAYFHECYAYEFRHSRFPDKLISKAHSKSEKAKLIGIHIIILTIMISETPNIIYLNFTIIIISLYIACAYIYYIPYFKFSFNVLEASSALFPAVLSIEFMIFERQTGLILLIFINPIIIWFLHLICKYRVSHINLFFSIKQYADVYEFERAYRKSLLNKKDSEGMLIIFNEAHDNLKLNNSKMLTIWEADYCLNILNDSKLASIKISSWFPLKNSNFEEGFLEYCLRTEIIENLYKTDEEAKFLLCIEKLEDWRKIDKEFCIYLNDSITFIHKKKYGISDAFSLVQTVYQKFIQLKNTQPNFPKSSNNFFKKNEFNYLMAAGNEQDYNLDAFEENNGVIIVSGRKNNVGKIFYSNTKASSILREPRASIINSDINEYIPKLFNFDHCELMKNYLKCCISAEIRHSYDSVLKTKSGLIIEIDMSVKCLSFEKHPFFLFLFKESSESSRWIMNENYRAIGYSGCYPSMLTPEHSKFILKDKNSEKLIFKEDTLIKSSSRELIDSPIISSKLKLNDNKIKQKNSENLSQEQSSYQSSSLANASLWEKYFPKIKKQYIIYRRFLFLFILTILSTNAIILVYTLTEISKAKNIDSLKETGFILDSMITISANVMKLDYLTYSNATNLTIAQGNDLINDLLLILKAKTKDMLNQVPSWNYCPQFSFYIKNEIPMWETTGKYKIVYKNLVDIVYGYEFYASEFLKKYNNNLFYFNEYAYLILNSYGVIAPRSKLIIDALSSCEKYRAENLTRRISWLIIDANIILFFCACFIIFIIFRICENYCSFYEQINKRLQTSFKSLHKKLITRLLNVHNYDPISIDNSFRSEPLKRWYDNNFLRIFSSISIYFLLTFTFYIIFYFYAYKNGENYLLARPDFISLFIKQQLFGRLLMFWARVYVFQDTPMSLSSRLSNFYYFYQPKSEYLNLIRSYNKLLKLSLLETKTQKLMSEDLKKLIFEKIDADLIQNNTLNCSIYGASLCQNEQIFDGNELFDSERDYDKFLSILKNMETFRSLMDTVNYKIIGMATDHSTKLIQENFELLTEVTIIYAIFSVIIYFWFYLPMISNELKRLEVLKRFCKLI